ncbi:hypothetical protein LOTGIDRAFT_152750 [Lottia gigantea]|uniref:Sulfotransferase domain-containing protein n=1 Tax=Lottia gigantea TaxID=225164 RepID=V4C7I8_LOTGI|nr:hypothetical protein LOTGIDRAFT_152750 [Lottia gigantea]ESO97659.1 hypothetical protein LOTGIDRAFT_152750 [Lottia gigantea]
MSHYCTHLAENCPYTKPKLTVDDSIKLASGEDIENEFDKPWKRSFKDDIVIPKDKQKKFTFNGKTYLQTRDPLDAIRAEFNRQYKGQLGYAPYSVYRKNWPAFTGEKAMIWYMFYLDWLEFKGPLHVIQYEKLRNDTAHEMQKLLRFLAVPYTQSDMSCMLRNREGDFKRKAVKKLKPFQRFPYNMTKLIESCKLNITKILTRN